MKRITAIALFSIATSIAAASASAQDFGIQAKVPFDFTVGNKMLPAGTYTISRTSSNMVTIRSDDKHNLILASTTHDSTETSSNKLSFDRYGDRYFLHAIHGSSAGINADIPTSKLEKKVQLEQARLEGATHSLVAVK